MEERKKCSDTKKKREKGTIERKRETETERKGRMTLFSL